MWKWSKTYCRLNTEKKVKIIIESSDFCNLAFSDLSTNLIFASNQFVEYSNIKIALQTCARKKLLQIMWSYLIATCVVKTNVFEVSAYDLVCRDVENFWTPV